MNPSPLSESRPTLEVIICTYNRERLLRNTLDALVAQRAAHDGRWAVLVVDNNCTDGTAELVEKYQGRLPGLRRTTESRQGLTEARQHGFHASDSPWVGFVDDDCVPEPDWVGQVLTHIAARPDIAGFNGRNILHFEDDKPRPWVHPEMFAAGGPVDDVEQERPFLHGAGLVLRRRAVERSGWINAPKAEDRRGNSLVSGGDNELAVRAKAGGEGGGLWFVPDCRIHHRVDVSRLGFSYLVRLNYRLAEAGPLLVAMQSPTLLGWHRFTLRYLGFRYASLVGIKRDEMITDGGGVRSMVLAISRVAGATIGYLKLAAKPVALKAHMIGIATPEWVESNAPDDHGPDRVRTEAEIGA